MVNAEPDSKSRLRLWLRLLKTSRGIEATLRERLRVEFSSTLPRFDVMAALMRHEDGLRMSELAGGLKVSNGNVTGIIERLVEDDMVERVAVKGDRRATKVRLTEAGKIHFEKLAQAHEVWIDELLNAFAPEDADYLSAQLQTVEDQTHD